MNKTKKLVALLLAILFAFSFAACTKKEAEVPPTTTTSTNNSATTTQTKTEIKYPEHGITLTSLAGTGTSYDNGLRLLLPYVEKELGVDITIEYNEAGSGWACWAQCLTTDPDGYSIFTTNFPAFFNCYNPDLGHKERWDDFDYLISFCTDENALFVRNESPIYSVEDFLNYCLKENDNSVIAVTPVAGDDHIAYLKMCQAIPELGERTSCMNGPKNLFTELLGGYVDALIGNVGNWSTLQDNCRCICVLSKERSPLLPDVPTFNEEVAKLGYTGVEIDAKTCRGLLLPKGMDEAVRTKLVDAFVAAYNNPDFKAEFTKNLQGWNLMYGDDYKKWIAEQDKYFQDVLAPLLGWK